ncbi:MAG: hypothetical protein FJZ90_09925, partial [Chloroflexi bacterium]|nr:hypothetical protein [Chloroflexota bacterium]
MVSRAARRRSSRCTAISRRCGDGRRSCSTGARAGESALTRSVCWIGFRYPSAGPRRSSAGGARASSASIPRSAWRRGSAEGSVSILAPGKRNLEEYYVASSVQEALAYLRAHHGEAQVIAGGTALMPQVQRGECTARRLVDISRIHAMKSITAHDGYLIVGGAVTFAALLASELVRQKAPLLHQAAMLVGTPQVRHLATLAGNVIWGDGAAEGAVALVALDSEVEITNFTGAQWLRVESVL